MSLPKIGIIHARDRHPAAQRLADLQDDEIAGLVLCDQALPLDEALERTWEQDSHLIMYRVDADPKGAEYAFARLKKKSPFVQQLEQAGGRVRVTSLVFDHDLPKADGVKQVWSADSLEEFLQVLQEAVGTYIPEPTAWYTTLHGSRFIYVLSKEVAQLDAEALMRGMIELFATAGIELDDACTDWTRLFRLPSTTRQDSGEPYTPEYILIDGERTIDPDDVPHIESSIEDSFADVGAYEGDRPDPDECRAMLKETKDNGRTYDTELVKRARALLKGRDSFSIIFEHTPLVEGDEGWNNTVFRVVGQVVGMLAREESATPEGIYALLFAAVEALMDREMRGARETDWFETVWDHVCRVWANEEAQIIAEQEKRDVLAAQAKEENRELVEKYREVRPDDLPEDPEEAQEFLRQRMIASNGPRHHVMRSDGSYNIKPVFAELLLAQIRDLKMDHRIPITEERGRNIVKRAPRDILTDHCTPIAEVECSAGIAIAFIDGAPGDRKLHIPIHQLNPKLRPVFDKRVDAWLQLLGGDRLIEWLSHSLDVGRATCALNLYGASGTGKGMLAAGLSECFDGGFLNDGRVFGKYTAGLMKSPVVCVDEGVPKSNGGDEARTVDQAFRSLVSGGKMMMRGMYADAFNATVYPRIMFTSNDRDIFNDIVGNRDLTEADVIAIEQRLLSIHVTPAAQGHLTGLGNFDYTKGWVEGAVHTELVLANHIFYLHQSRRKSQIGNGRLLVEGESNTKLVSELRMSTPGAETTLQVLVKMIESPNDRGGLHVHDGRVWVTASGVASFANNNLANYRDNLTLKKAGKALRMFEVQEGESGGEKNRVAKTKPPGAEIRGRWYEVDLGVIYERARSTGMEIPQVERLLRSQFDGDQIITEIDAIYS